MHILMESVTFYSFSIKSSTWKITAVSIPLFYTPTEEEDVVIGEVRYHLLSCQLTQKSPHFKVFP